MTVDATQVEWALATLAARVREAEAERDALRWRLAAVTEERDVMQAIFAGRTVGPSDAECDVHRARGGWWLLSGSPHSDPELVQNGRDASAWCWWAVNADGGPCPWPHVTGEGSEGR